jgi:hypothetical protein
MAPGHVDLGFVYQENVVEFAVIIFLRQSASMQKQKGTVMVSIYTDAPKHVGFAPYQVRNKMVPKKILMSHGNGFDISESRGGDIVDKLQKKTVLNPENLV